MAIVESRRVAMDNVCGLGAPVRWMGGRNTYMLMASFCTHNLYTPRACVYDAHTHETREPIKPMATFIACAICANNPVYP